MYSIIFSNAAEKGLRSLPHATGDKILQKIGALQNGPRPAGCKKLSGFTNTYRIRIGDYRVLYDIYDDTLVIIVIKISHRQSAY